MLKLLVTVFRSLLLPRSGLVLENLALCHQLAMLKRSSKRPRLREFDRILWVWLSRLWPNWRSSLVIVKPGTVIRWHHQGFMLYWAWLYRPKRTGRTKIPLQLRELNRRMSRDNPTWGVSRIHDELALLGIHVAESTIRIEPKLPTKKSIQSI